ncbi:MAG: amidase [Dehalococcoidia bacterium]
MTDLTNLTIVEAAHLLERHEISAAELLEAHLDRIAATDGAVNSFVLVMADSARQEARASDERTARGARLGALDGIPIAVKDLYDTAGAVTTGGTGAYRDRVPSEDATAVAKLRAAGAVIVGKANTHELAFGGTTNNIHYGATRNPWNLERVPGGSSGGSGSALAARQAIGALGTDTGGSIRIPATFCGITGHKPTYGLVSRAGVVPMSHTLDHAGPMARSALDCALMLNALQGYDGRDLDSVPRPAVDFTAGIEDGVRGLRLAIIPSMLDQALPAVEANFRAAVGVLGSLGADIIEVEPMASHPNWRQTLTGLVSVESYAYHEELMLEEPCRIGPSVRGRIAQALEKTPWDYARALDARKLAEQRFEATLREEGLAGYLAPTSPIVAFPIDADQERDEAPTTIFVNTTVFDMTHQPSISVPAGFDEDGLPTGLMISAALWDDATALRAAHAFQGVTDWHTKTPELAVAAR